MAGDSKSKQIPDRKKPDLSEIHEMRKILQNILKPDRYEHSLSVSFTSIALAMRYDYDLKKAEIAGLCHDCAKHFSKDELLKACKKEGIELSEDLKNSPQVLHSIYGPYYARKLFGIEDEEILSAIYYHTLGRPEMSLLEKIIFTADYIEARRWKAERLPELRKLAFQDLDLAVYEILKDTVEYLLDTGDAVCEDSLKSYEYYKALIESRKSSNNG